MKGCLAAIFVILISALVIGHLSRSLHQQRIEGILKKRVVEIEKSFPEIRISYDHLTAQVTGKATREELKVIKERVEDRRRGNGRVEYTVEIVGSLPTIFSIVRESGKITVQGTVDSEETKRDLGSTAGLGDRELTVDNRLEVSDEVIPFPSLVAAVAAIPLLINSAEDSRLEVEPGSVSVSGRVASEEVKQTVSWLFTSEKWNGAEIRNELTVIAPKPLPPQPQPPHFSWKQEGSKIVLEGAVASKADRDRLSQVAKELADARGLVVEDRIKVESSVLPAQWIRDFPGFASATLPRIKDPDFQLGPEDSRFAGTIAGRDAKREVCEAITEFDPPGLVTNLALIEKPPESTKQSFADNRAARNRASEKGGQPQMKPEREKVDHPNSEEKAGPDGEPLNPPIQERHQVFFGTGEYHIRSSQKEAVAGILARVRSTEGAIQIDGYADERGDPGTNIFLSRKRAERIEEYLIKNGVDPKRISDVTGHGAQPGMTYPEFRKTEVRIMK